MQSHASAFLTAQWRHLAMLNYEIDPKVLQPLVPAGTELPRISNLIQTSRPSSGLERLY